MQKVCRVDLDWGGCVCSMEASALQLRLFFRVMITPSTPQELLYRSSPPFCSFPRVELRGVL